MTMKLNCVFLASLFMAVACGGTKGEGDDGPTAQSTTNECQKGCDQAAECEDAPLDLAESCGESCKEVADAADEAGCLGQIDALVKCTTEEFSCVVTTAVCESETEDYAVCMTRAEEEQKKISAEACREACSTTAECDDVPASFESTCSEACNNSVAAAYDAGCGGAFEVYLDCSKNAFDCANTESPCAREAEDFIACMSE